MIDEIAVAKIFATLMGCWAMGYGIGAAMAWTKKIVEAA